MQSNNTRILAKVLTSNSIGVTIITILLTLYLVFTQPNFLTGMNIQTLLTTVGVLFIVAIGQTFILLTGGIDLSVGSQLLLVGILLSFFLNSGVPELFAVILSLVAGTMLGALNGILIGPIRMSFIVVTLGAMIFWQGIVNLWTGGKTTFVESNIVVFLGSGRIAGIPMPVVIMFLTLIISAFILRYTRFGRNIYAVGGNMDAARLSGIKTSKTIVLAYAYCGLLTAIASVVQVGRIGAASPSVAGDLMLLSAAAVLLGGTSFKGGIGGVGGTAIGVLFIGILINGLGLAGVSSYWQQIATGLILVSVVFFDKVKQS